MGTLWLVGTGNRAALLLFVLLMKGGGAAAGAEHGIF